MNILTFDIEEWFHYDAKSDVALWDNYEVRIFDSLDRILNALEKRSQKATFFCMGWIARKHPKLLLQIKNAGHEIGCHSDMHKFITDLSIIEFRKDTEMAINSIEDVINDKIKMYRAPAFSITERNTWAFDVLIENGIEIDCSIFPASHDYGGYKSFGSTKPSIIKTNGNLIKEFPMSTGFLMGKPLVYSGGGFFRLYPYWVIKKLILSNDYVMTYFHPRDFDVRQPVLRHLPVIRLFKSYYGLYGAFSKFSKLLDEFNFVSVLEASHSIDWENVRIVNL